MTVPTKTFFRARSHRNIEFKGLVYMERNVYY